MASRATNTSKKTTKKTTKKVTKTTAKKSKRAKASEPSEFIPWLVTRDEGFERVFRKLCDRRNQEDADVEKVVRGILDKVARDGDGALLALIKKFDGATLESVEVTKKEWEAGIELVGEANRAALGRAASRVRDFYRRRIPGSWEIKEEGGATLGQHVRPLHRVGLYVPGGKASYPSSVIMNAVPAAVFGVREIVMATPPNADGTLRPEVLLAARFAGVHRIFKMGGAQAIAALAYGTQSVPKVDKIVGPGNIFVATAKRLVFGRVDVDSEAGPSEILVVADKSANPNWVAADLISQAEHDELARAILVTHVQATATKVLAALEKQLATLDRASIAKKCLKTHGAVVLTRSLDESLGLANRYAPEHLALEVDNPEVAAKAIENAGAIFLGHYTPEAVGDYLAGPSHVLPTGGTARFFSPLGVEDFAKRTSIIRFEPNKLRELGADVIRLAEMEGLTGHGNAVALRLETLRNAPRGVVESEEEVE